MNHTQLLALTIGRVPGTAIQLEDPSVSASHAMISVHDGRLFLADVGSTNGTFVNGQRVTSAFVTPNDRVLIGAVPFPWHHPNVAPLLAAVGAAAPASPSVSLHRPSEAAPQASSASSPVDDDPPALPVAWTGRRIAIALGAISVIGAVGVFGFFRVGGSTSNSIPELTSAPSTAPVAGLSTTPVALPTLDLSLPTASHLFAERMADQVDVRRQQERVEETRFRLWSQVISEGIIFDEAKPPRSSWGVPLGLVDGPRGQSLAVGTTRCLIDYSYPFERMHRDRASFRNLAIYTGLEPNTGRDAQVFRLIDPAHLPGTRYASARKGHLYRNPFFSERFGSELRDDTFGVSAELVEGNWGDSSGVDFVILYFPLADPGVQTLQPRENRTLNMRDPRERMAEALGGRTSLWGDTFRFSLVSEECMEATNDAFATHERSHQMLQVFAIATAVVLVGVISGGLGTAMFASLKTAVAGIFQSRIARTFATQALGAVWRTLVRSMNGESFRDAMWDEAGRLVVHFTRENGELEQTVIAGITREGLSEDAARHVVGAVRSLVTSGGEFTLPTLSREGTEVGSLMDASRQLDVGAELLARGVVRLDMRDPSLFTQQPTLVRAARDALVRDASPLVADPSYRARLETTSATLAIQ
jgi:hypothetical protein